MLLRFEVGNHRSIREPVELSMIAVDKDRAAARQLQGLGERVLAVTGIYGANGSGKTNLIDALAWLSHAVAVSLRAWEDEIPCDPFSFASGPREPSAFGIEIVVGGVRYRYELELDQSRVTFEALYSYPQQRRRTLFERDGDDVAFRRGTHFIGGGRELITPTTLILSAASRLTEEMNSVARWLRDIEFVGYWPRAFMGKEARLYRPGGRWWSHGWDEYLLEVFDDASSHGHPGEGPPRKDRREHRDLARAMLMFADLGIRDVEVVDEPLGHGRGGRRLRLLHDVAGEPQPLELGDESDGTLTWLGLIPDLIGALDKGGVIVVDELDSSLHPVISGKLVELFQDPATNRHGAQLMFTTHDTSLLGCLNRDEVWLTDKRSGGSTELTALSDFRSSSARRSTNLERGYLQGRFGGVPVVDQYRVLEALGIAGQD
ncbi:MAG: ATP-binding protein [Acidimicrobiaceae bacterium]|nr:ATP-binding protein [Acidimicrobiaceae bacterium]